MILETKSYNVFSLIICHKHEINSKKEEYLLNENVVRLTIYSIDNEHSGLLIYGNAYIGIPLSYHPKYNVYHDVNSLIRIKDLSRARHCDMHRIWKQYQNSIIYLTLNAINIIKIN